jgi:hypothetical protein
VGAVWALTGGYHDTTALCVRDSEFVRMSKVTTPYLDCLNRSDSNCPFVTLCCVYSYSQNVHAPGQQFDRWCCSQGAFELLAQQNPRATSRMLEGMARRIAAASSARGRRSRPAMYPLFYQSILCMLQTDALLTACMEARGLSQVLALQVCLHCLYQADSEHGCRETGDPGPHKQ